MKKLTLMLSLLTAGMFATRASAVTTLYDNGAPSDTSSTGISGVVTESDSFTLSTPSTVTGAQVALWAISPSVPSSVDWAIGTTAFGSEIDSGSASLSNTLQDALGFVDVYESTFALNESLGAGTYWLTLHNGHSTPDNGLLWDINGGPSSAQDSSLETIPSESFQILGTATSAPEPVTATLLGLAGAGLIGYGVKRRRA